MRNTKSLNFVLGLVIYPFDIMFSFNESDDALLKRLKYQRLNESDLEQMKYLSNTTRAHYVLFSNHASLIRMKIIPVIPEDFAILQHEIFHAVHFILDFIGMKLTKESDEAYSYLTEFITKNIYMEIFKGVLKK